MMKNKLILSVKAVLAGINIGKNIDNSIWIFSSTDNEQYNYNSKYLFEYIKDNIKGITPYYVMNDPEKREALQQEYGEQYFIESRTVKGMRKVLKSGVWFTSAGLPVYGIGLKRSHTIINLWHGVPLKKVGLMDSNLKGIARKYFKFVFSDNYKYVVTTSENLVPIMAESFGMSSEAAKIWGQPRNDGLFQKHDMKSILKKLYANLPEYDKIILYAPTFRDNNKETRLFPFLDYDVEKMEHYLEEKKIILFIRSHINASLEVKRGAGRRIQILNSDKLEDITSLLGEFDLLITDYSSIYIDYLLVKKPIIFLPYDKDEYLRNRGMNFNYDEVTPGPKPDNLKDFLNDIEQLLFGEDCYKEQRHRVNEFFNGVQRPCSREICESIISELEIPVRKAVGKV